MAELDWGVKEAGILRRCMDDPAVMSDCLATFGDYTWTDSGIEWVWRFVSSMFETAGEAPDLDLLATAALGLPGNGDGPPEPVLRAVDLIASTPAERRHRAVRRMLLGRDAKRRAMATIDKAVDQFSRGRDAEAIGVLSSAALLTSTQKRPTVQTLIPRSRSRIVKMRRCPTGLHKLDKLLGGIAKGETGLAMGVTGVGKSTVGVNFGHSAIRHGWNVLHVDTENGVTLTQARYISRFTGVPHDLIEEDRLSVSQQERVDGWLDRNYERLAKHLRVLYLGVQESTIADFDAAIMKTIADGYTPDMIIFDSPDHLKLGNQNGFDMAQRWAYFADLYQNLTGRAKRYNVGLWLTNQADEAAANTLATTKHGRDSQQKVKDASIVLSINRNPDNPEDQARRTIYVSKGRSKAAMYRIDINVDLAVMKLEAPLDDLQFMMEVPFERQ